MDRYAQYAMVASEEAVTDAGFDFETLDKDRAGVIWGSGIGGLETFQMLNFAGRWYKFNPFFIQNEDIACGHISIKYGFRGLISQLFQLASTNAIIDAFNYIRLGHADVMVTGGSEAAVTIAGMVDSMPCMHCPQEMNPTTASRPMDRTETAF
jgi:3-oxoacyl-[acyl-carrier-protein] synthase II